MQADPLNTAILIADHLKKVTEERVPDEIRHKIGWVSIEKAVQNGSHLALILRALPAGYQGVFLETFFEKICKDDPRSIFHSAFQIAEVFDALKTESEKIKLLRMININQDWLNEEILKTGTQLMKLVYAIPKNKCSDFLFNPALKSTLVALTKQEPGLTVAIKSVLVEDAKIAKFEKLVEIRNSPAPTRGFKKSG